MANQKYLLTQELKKAEYSGMTDQQRYDDLKSMIPVKIPIMTRDVQQYLFLTDDYLPIKRGTTDAAELAMDALTIFAPQFDYHLPVVEAKLVSVLDALVADTSLVFSEADKTAILALGESTITKEKTLGFRPLRLGEIAEART